LRGSFNSCPLFFCGSRQGVVVVDNRSGI
jgi:hypothetical protein